jgi:hypothetical protein
MEEGFSHIGWKHRTTYGSTMQEQNDIVSHGSLCAASVIWLFTVLTQWCNFAACCVAGRYTPVVFSGL